MAKAPDATAVRGWASGCLSLGCAAFILLWVMLQFFWRLWDHLVDDEIILIEDPSEFGVGNSEPWISDLGGSPAGKLEGLSER